MLDQLEAAVWMRATEARADDGALPRVAPAGATCYYAGSYDPLATFRRLRAAGVLGRYSYLHVAPDRAEIGWAPVEHLRVGDGLGRQNWRAALQTLADHAVALDRKAFGYVGFDAADGASGSRPDRSDSGCPLVEFIVPGELIAFNGDQVEHRTRGAVDLGSYLARREPAPRPAPPAPPLQPVTRLPDSDYVDSVHRATLALRAGEAQKAVLSRYQAYDVDYDPVDLFAAYCLSQSFVDAFLVCFDDVVAVVASPEMLLSVTEHTLLTNPLAGTRKRGATVEEDERLRQELRADRKEMAEHVFSVTTMLDELTPVCAPGTLAVTRLLDVALQQKVQHLSSVIAGRLAEGVGALDAIWALFPSVTVTGLPKSAALPLVRRLEAHPRGIYAGALGWAAGRGDCRFSLAIRGIFRYGERSFLQAGAGIMPESRPEAELAETAHKLRAMEDALASVIGETACPHVLR